MYENNDTTRIRAATLASTKLASASALIRVVCWLKPDGEPIARDFVPTKADDTYQATLTVPDRIQGLALVFENGKTKDRNNDQTILLKSV